MEREHLVVLATQEFIANLDDQPVRRLRKTAIGMVRGRRRTFQNGVGGYHFSWDKVMTDAEMLERALGLRTPEFAS